MHTETTFATTAVIEIVYIGSLPSKGSTSTHTKILIINQLYGIIWLRYLLARLMWLSLEVTPVEVNMLFLNRLENVYFLIFSDPSCSISRQKLLYRKYCN